MIIPDPYFLLQLSTSLPYGLAKILAFSKSQEYLDPKYFYCTIGFDNYCEHFRRSKVRNFIYSPEYFLRDLFFFWVTKTTSWALSISVVTLTEKGNTSGQSVRSPAISSTSQETNCFISSNHFSYSILMSYTTRYMGLFTAGPHLRENHKTAPHYYPNQADHSNHYQCYPSISDNRLNQYLDSCNNFLIQLLLSCRFYNHHDNFYHSFSRFNRDF